ncbi:LuxR C-terminal-related transcriptional regulator [Streptomyces sp. CA-249302]|uniref:LuxR C-terminal-related transcriptional regulator n=1 Tax=Streptomyces sp. CA-249302 TaxID=3240058 RepID=UPI003D8F9302
MAHPPLRTERPFGQVRPPTTTGARNNIRSDAHPGEGRKATSVAAAPHGSGTQRDEAITVGIADHEILVRGGIRAMLERAEGIRVVGEAQDPGAVVALVSRDRPAVLLIDGAMAGTQGARVIGVLRRLAPMTAVVVLAPSPEGSQLDRVLRAGVAGCLLKSGDPQDIVGAVRVAAAGGAVLGPEVAKRVLERVAEIDTDRIELARELIGGLTRREREVLALVAQGMANVEIGRALHLSEGGVKAHISRLLTKLECGNRVRAALIAHDAGLTGASTEVPEPGSRRRGA